MVEVAIVIKIVQNLYRAWQGSKKKLTIGVVSPYSAQIVSIQEKLANKYARNRHCLFDADVDQGLKKTIINSKKELEQLDDLINRNSVLFRHARWKLTSAHLKKLVLNLLLKLSGGWRPKNRNVNVYCEKSSQILKQIKVEGLYVICAVDIIKDIKYIQVLKVWDVLPFEEIPKLTKRLEYIFSAYTEDYINRCTAKCLEGNLEVRKCWPPFYEIIRFRYITE